ncbi:UDP-N-acetylglucosamine 1-carboxyvinyltransferase [Kiloniella litopenaei]|uniref:UDP-N-acetylglucosamine 1-carboxyvinyltransferase n=1 Tax=Kiloniella litopenaei TaxID=1549748 RepID=A0A0M2R8A0_9PROT|nr:UDP-N-acetylglucosamine 1-carboxyvinyltransferase [Kiloniella litopenaei]KKJ76654.1 UDP-N-acetylglucosamine 1-carboxyvinyltransferase [Kiloniella litopenaei]
MDKIKIRGGNPLKGKIWISGAKNAALPLMTASLLTDEVLTLRNLPHLADITTLANLLAQHGVELHMNGSAGSEGCAGRVLEMHAKTIETTKAPYELVRKMRASILVLGPLLAREGHAEVSLPGGCAIGSRPVDLHLQGMEQLGAEIELKEGYVHAKAPKGLIGGEVMFPKVSVGATENIMMAAVLAKGTTRMINAAREPEVVDLAECLMGMGANIQGAGTDTITIEGVDRLHGYTHTVVPDRIETGTYAMAAAMTGGELELVGARPEHLRSMIDQLAQAGVSIEELENGMIARCSGERVMGTDIMTEPYPGYPTDLQAQTMALMSTADGASMITETIFENRFMHVPELCRMGANITVHGSSALVRGQAKLTGAEVMATDLRASFSLIMAGLVADGETVLNRVYHLDRGYERVEDKLAACGADIERIKGE